MEGAVVAVQISLESPGFALAAGREEIVGFYYCADIPICY
jgi:hypothetical protein